MRRSEREKKAVADECWSRSCEVSEPQKHPQEFTIYKVVLKMIPRSTTDDEYEILVYKRYRQFRRLHKTLSSYHEKLHRQDKFPPFTKPQMFGRFDSQVIEERRQAAEIFLNFCCEHRHLYTHSEFMLFFEGGIRSTPKSSLRNPVEPFDFPTFSGPQSICSDTTSSEPRPSITEETENLTFPSPPRNEDTTIDILPPLVTTDGDSFDGQADSIVDATLASPLPEADLSFFDPCSAVDREVPNGAQSSDSTNQSNFWLLSAMDACSEPDVGISRRVADLTFENKDVFETPSQEQKAKSGVKGFFVNLKEKARPRRGSGSESPSPAESYIYNAAAFINHAQSLEEDKQYEAAFNAYKSGVGILLAGVQTDSDPARREVVRQRTGRYLVHAEAIYNQYLTGGDGDAVLSTGQSSASQSLESSLGGEQRWQISDSSVMLSLDPTLSRLHFSVAELRSYKVLGILHERVLLVMDLSANQTCVIKSIRKCSVPDNEVQPCVPVNIPFMVRLHKIIETEDTIYLVLEYATGGRLYDFVKEYLTNFHGGDEVDRPIIRRSDLHTDENVYTGQQFAQVGDINGRRGEDVSSGTVENLSKRSSDSDHSLERRDEGATHAPGYIDMFSQCIADFEQQRSHEDSLGDAQEAVFPDVERAMEQSIETRSFQRVLNGATNDVVTNNFSIESVSSNEPEAEAEVFEEGEEEEEEEEEEQEEKEKKEEEEQEEKEEEDVPAVVDVPEPPVESPVEDASIHDRSSRSRSASAGRRQYSRQRSHSIGGTEGKGPKARAWSTVFAQLDAERSKEAGPAPQLPESCLRQWAAEVVTALICLHRRGLVVGDLHPSNILLGRGGHVLLTHMSRWKQAPWRPSPEAVRGGYAAPEVMTLDGPQASSDWFSLGVILYELLTGKAFIAAFPGGISSHSVIQLPSHVSSETQDLVHNLLTYHSNQRLGSGNVTSDIKLHPFFKDIDWKKLRT